MARFDSAIALAERLIAKNGETTTFERTTPVEGSAPWEPNAPTVEEIEVSAVWLNRSILRADALAKEGEAYVLVAGASLATTPDPTRDRLVRADGTRFSVMRAEPLDPNGQMILYELRVKR